MMVKQFGIRGKRRFKLKNNIFIPKTINVGYQNRKGTYTGKLAYVIYYDEKGKLRKETSWNGWRDQDISNEEFENVPTEGFVLNKKVGDCSTGWDHRQAYCRVYDPRNFEFEITIENLLYILENTNSIKGKGLEGEFVYGWSGKDLILIPVESPDYKEIQEYNSIVYRNESIKAKDLIIGATYLTKDNIEFVYMGKHEYYSSGYEWIENGETKRSKNLEDIPMDENSRWKYYSLHLLSRIEHKYVNNFPYGKYFWFAYKEYDQEYKNGEFVNKSTYEWKFDQFKNISRGKFIKCIDEKCTSVYSEIYESMVSNYHYSPYDESKDKYVEFTLDEFIEMFKKLGRYSVVSFISEFRGEKQNFYIKRCTGDFENQYELYEDGGRQCYDIFPTRTIRTQYGKLIDEMIPVTIEEIFKVMKPMYVQEYLENGREYRRRYKL